MARRRRTTERGVSVDKGRQAAESNLGGLCSTGAGEVGLFPGWRLHPLKGDLKGFLSVTITGNWRVIFRFADGDAFDVDLVDYH